MTITVGDSKSLTAIVLPVGAPQAVIWSSSNEAIFSVAPNGSVVTHSVGIADAIATTVNGLTAACKVTVKAQVIEPVSVKMRESEVYMDWQEERQLAAEVLPASADQTIVWTTSNQYLLTVDETGYIKPKGAGDATITATASNGVSADCIVHLTLGGP